MRWLISSIIFAYLLLLSFGCGVKEASLLKSYSGYVAIATVATAPATGPGIVALFDTEGELVEVIEDGYATGTGYPSGVAYLGDAIFAVFTEVSESL